MNTKFVVLRHPDNRRRRVLHRISPEETVGTAVRLASTYFGLARRAVLVDPFTGERLGDQRRCPPGEYDLAYE